MKNVFSALIAVIFVGLCPTIGNAQAIPEGNTARASDDPAAAAFACFKKQDPPPPAAPAPQFDSGRLTALENQTSSARAEANAARAAANKSAGIGRQAQADARGANQRIDVTNKTVAEIRKQMWDPKTKQYISVVALREDVRNHDILLKGDKKTGINGLVNDVASLGIDINGETDGKGNVISTGLITDIKKADADSEEAKKQAKAALDAAKSKQPKLNFWQLYAVFPAWLSFAVLLIFVVYKLRR